MPDRAPIIVTLTALEGGAVTLSPEGEIGYHEAPAFRNAIREAYDKRPKRLIVDLSKVGYMGTPGVATLVEALQISKKTGTPLVLCGMNDRVRGVFEIAQLHKVFKMTPDLAGALVA